VAYWPALVARELVRPTLVTAAGERTLDWPTPLLPAGEPAEIELPELPKPGAGTAEVRVPLSQLAHARSGDKGDTANIGVIARAPGIYAWLVKTLTAARVKEYFAGLCEGEVTRHEVPNLWALNFLLAESLGGGGTVSLRLDAQGKTLSHALLAMEVRVPRSLVEAARRGDDEHREALGLPKTAPAAPKKAAPKRRTGAAPKRRTRAKA
jgi:hypothetical protein